MIKQKYDSKFEKEIPIFDSDSKIKLKIIDKRMINNQSYIQKFIQEIEKSVVVKNFTEVEDMVESIFESMP